MAHSIKTVYVVHHSHTDIGYTDLQERVIAIQVNYIKTVLSMMRQPEYADFRWNCETLYCVEEFWKQASEEDRADFARFVKEGKIGISANYLNFNDLVNADVFGKRLAKWQDKLQPFGTKIHTAMAADVNGFSMGYRDAMIENGVEFFFTNVHCHHGMYPLYQNQNAFFWENASGQRLLVWNGEHYNLGNVLGLQPNHAVNWMMRNRLGEDADAGTFFSDQLHTNLDKYLTECETEGYPYDFIVTAVSGVFSDNAPPSAEIMETIRAYNEKYGQEVRVEMVSLQELYAAIAPKLTDAPVYRGDWTDWWTNGVGSTPYAVKHYKDADHRWQLANRLDPDAETHYPALAEAVQDNLMLYAEHRSSEVPPLMIQAEAINCGLFAILRYSCHAQSKPTNSSGNSVKSCLYRDSRSGSPSNAGAMALALLMTSQNLSFVIGMFSCQFCIFFTRAAAGCGRGATAPARHPRHRYSRPQPSAGYAAG